MGLNPSNVIAEKDHGPVFPNVAGHPNPDDILRAELEAAGIPVFESEIHRAHQGEVKTAISGTTKRWSFDRAWYYWVAKGDGLPPRYARELHEIHGREVRVDGHCMSPSPEYYDGFAVGLYHVDTPRGLKALADMLKRVVREHKTAATAAKEPK